MQRREYEVQRKEGASLKVFHWESRIPVPILNTVMGGQSAMTDLTVQCG